METVRASLACFKDVYGQLTPFERRELMRLLLRRAEVSDRLIVLEIYRPLARSRRAGKTSWRQRTRRPRLRPAYQA
jgi:hypothetical protein